jgi:hypothetical protein
MPKGTYKPWTKAEKRELRKAQITTIDDVRAFAQSKGRTYNSVMGAYRRLIGKKLAKTNVTKTTAPKKIKDAGITYVVKNCKSVEINGSTLIIRM